MSDPTPLGAMTPQEVTEYAVWYARKVKGPAADVAARLLNEVPWLREPLEAEAAISTTPAPDALRPCPWCGHPPMCHKGPEGECVESQP